MNKVILMGRLTKDPELRYTGSNNAAVCNFNLAVDRRFVKQGEERQADFIPIVLWNKPAEFVGKYFTKGKMIVIVGRIQTRTWDDNEGKKHYVTEVVGEEAYFAGGKNSEGSGGTGGFSRPPSNSQEEGFYPIDDADDELPF